MSRATTVRWDVVGALILCGRQKCRRQLVTNHQWRPKRAMEYVSDAKHALVVEKRVNKDKPMCYAHVHPLYLEF